MSMSSRVIATMLALLASLGATTCAYAGSGVSESEIVQTLRAKGLTFRLGNDSFKEPLIESYSGSVRFYVYFYECDAQRRCANIQFRTGYATRGRLTLAKVNDWSTRWRFGRLYLDPEGDAILDMDVELKNGANDALLSASLDRWIDVMKEAEGFIGWRR